MTINGAINLFTPSCIMHQKSDTWRSKFTPCEPQKPMKCLQLGCLRKVK